MIKKWKLEEKRKANKIELELCSLKLYKKLKVQIILLNKELLNKKALLETLFHKLKDLYQMTLNKLIIIHKN